MTTYEELVSHLASPEFRQRFIYYDAPRNAVSADDVDARQLGHMLESLTDAMVFMRRLSDNPQIDVMRNSTLEPHHSSSPAFMDEFVNDPRTGPSFVRSDMPIPRIKAKVPLNELADELHVILRRQGNMIGKTLVMPEGVETLFDEYDAKIKQYKDMVRAQGDHTQVTDEEKQKYTQSYNEVASRLFTALKALPEVSLAADGKIYTVPNNLLVNPLQPDSCPAFVMAALRSIGKEGIDRNRRPPAEFRRISDIVGVESLISDTTQGLLDHVKDTCGSVPASCDINRTQLKETLTQHTRPVQLALAFCRVANCGYKALYDDLTLFIRMAGAEPNIDKLETPKEVALLLHAVERRFAREDKEAALQKKLQSFIQPVSQCRDMDELAAQFSGDMEFQRALMASRQQAAAHGLSSVIPALDQIQAALTQPDRARRIASQRSQGRNSSGQGGNTLG